MITVFRVGSAMLLARVILVDDLLDLDLHGSIPNEFSLSFSVFGENFEAVRTKILFRLMR